MRRPLALLAAAETQGAFSVLTYNIAGLPEPLSGSNPEANTPLIGSRIGGYDVVNVQEDFNYHASLYAADDHPYRTCESLVRSRESPIQTCEFYLRAAEFSSVSVWLCLRALPGDAGDAADQTDVDRVPRRQRAGETRAAIRTGGTT